MRTQSNTLAGLSPRSKPVFNVVLVYEDLALGRYAVGIYHRILLEYGNEFDARVRMWTADYLRNIQLDKSPVNTAAEARMIVIATKCAYINPAVRKWVEEWRSRPAVRNAILVAVLNCPTKTANNLCPAETYLRSVAAGTGREFILETITPAGYWRSVSFPGALRTVNQHQLYL